MDCSNTRYSDHALPPRCLPLHGHNACSTVLTRPCRCTELELSHAQALSGLDDPRFQSFLTALAGNVNVRKIELENLQLDDAMVKAIVNALIDRSMDLYSLELTNQNFGDDGADAVAAFLAKTSSLRSISLARNHIGDIGVAAIANALPPSLHEVDLSWNSIGDKGVEALMQAVTHGSMVRVEKTWLWLALRRVHNICWMQCVNNICWTPVASQPWVLPFIGARA